MEMELMNLLLCNRVPEVVRFLRMYSTCEDDRQALIAELLAGDCFGVGRVEAGGAAPRTKEILDVFLANLGLRLAGREED
jgi:hypothetical protein